MRPRAATLKRAAPSVVDVGPADGDVAVDNGDPMVRHAAIRANVLGVLTLLVLVALFGVLTVEEFDAARATRVDAQRSDTVFLAIKDLDIAIRDAETGQRGYLLTGQDDYLAPYNAALGRITLLSGRLDALTEADPVAHARFGTIGTLLQRKLEELAETVALRRTDGLPAALRLVETDRGRTDMVKLEAQLATLGDAEQHSLDDRLHSLRRRSALARGFVFAGILLSLLALGAAARQLNAASEQARLLEREQRVLASRLRASLDSLSQGVAVFDADRLLIDWNPCFLALVGLDVTAVRPGLPHAAIVALAAGSGVSLEDDPALHGSRLPPSDVVVYEAARPDGHHLEIRRTVVSGGGFVLTLSDMTRRMEAERALREAQKMQAIGRLTGGIAHDFNNLLTVILGNLESLQARLADNPALATRVERATWAAQRGATLTAQLLAFARRQPLAPQPVDLAATVPALVPLLRRTLGEDIDVRYHETASLWPAMADAAQLESAVLNLALNARDAMRGGGRLTIEVANKVIDADYARAHAEVLPGDYVMLAVTDSGHGMPPEILARVFEPFFTTKPDGQGTGLGLAMVFGFVKQSGGHVKAYSEPGEGTTIRLYLPRAASRPVSPSVPTREREKPAAAPAGTTVLVVEDDAAVREVAVSMLRDFGYRVFEAEDGETGLAVFQANRDAIDLLLTDVVLPGRLRGRELAERASALRPGLRVLFMSGYTENSIVHQGRLDDGVALLSKPFRRDTLARRVADLLDAGSAAERPSSVVDFRPRRGD